MLASFPGISVSKILEKGQDGEWETNVHLAHLRMFSFTM